jgi:hypothetical protein
MVATSIVVLKENNMGQMKALMMDIETMLNDGHSVNYTSAYLDVPVDIVADVYEALSGPDGGEPDYDASLEATGWREPDC